MKVQGLSFKPKALAVLPELHNSDLEATFKIYNDDYNIVASMEAISLCVPYASPTLCLNTFSMLTCAFFVVSALRCV